MDIYLTTFLIAVSLAVVLTPVSRWFSIRIGAMDTPSERKVHRSPIPSMGGLAIVIAFMIPVVGILLSYGQTNTKISANTLRIIALLIGGVGIVALGIIDDTKGVRARYKFIVQIGIAVGVWLVGFQFGRIGLPFIGSVEFPWWLDLPISVLWIAGIINAINIIDGLDGLAAGVTFFAASTNFFVSINTGNLLGAIFSATIAGASIGFLLFNWNPATVFMGDTGSMFLGYILATTSLFASHKTSTALGIMIPVIALGVPVIDTLISMLRRIIMKQPIFTADKGHLHHRLLRAGLTQRRAVLVIYTLCIVFSAIAIAMTAAKDITATVVLGVMAVVVFGIVRFFGFFNFSRAVSSLQQSRMVKELRPKISDFTARDLSALQSVDEVWNALLDLSRQCSFKEVSWRIIGTNHPEHRHTLLYDKNSPEYMKASHKGFLRAKASANIGPASYIELTFSYPTNLGKIDPASDLLFDITANTVASALTRLEKEGKWLDSHFADIQPEIEQPCHEEQPAEEMDQITNHSSRGHHCDSKRQIDILDKVWKHFIQLCQDHGFIGADWKTVGVKPADIRQDSFWEYNSVEKCKIRQSLPITALSFIELGFVYKGKPGKKPPPEVSQSITLIYNKLTSDIDGIRHQFNS
jgi:UDP-GlcNAc:undecaprenyl-phosphate GlcNAc-1-phosphate transferase